jgi:hypothetical protein
LFCSLAFGCTGEYFQATWALASFSFTPMSSDTTSALATLQPKSNGHFSLFFEDYELNQNLELSFDYFKLTFQCMPHLSTSDIF